ncbi:MAG: tetratricopeptide repeat protein [Acidobacteria bacterium]|nr:tetratricopeptide repeat protein [Acidobacteriota bacterium]
MTSRSVSIFFTLLLSLLLIAVPALMPENARAQDYTEEEYNRYQTIDAEADPVKKTDMVVAFIKEKPESSLRAYLEASFQRLVADLSQQQNWSQIISLGQKFLTVAPNDKTTIDALTYAYSSTGNLKGFTTYGEKTYAANPSPELAYSIAIAYLQLDNGAKFLQWGKKVPASSPNYVVVLTQMMRRTAGNEQDKYARECLKILPAAKKPEGMGDKDWQEMVNGSYATAYAVLGASSYQSGSYSTAIKNLENSLKYNSRNETAYYFLGMSYWRNNQMDAAMLNFAKAYLLKGSTSAQSKKYLDQLWSSSHRGSLAGVDRVIQRAQQEMK